jgi:hypothetical protein
VNQLTVYKKISHDSIFANVTLEYQNAGAGTESVSDSNGTNLRIRKGREGVGIIRLAGSYLVQRYHYAQRFQLRAID